MEESSGESLKDCLQLLKGDGKDQLTGILLITKHCNQGDHDAIHRVYDAIGPDLFRHLLHSGMGRGKNREAFLQLSVALLAAFCRVPEIAASEHMLTLIPLVVQIMSEEPGFPVPGDCLEILVSVSNVQENCLRLIYMSGGMQLLASLLYTSQDGSFMAEMALKLVQMILSKLPAEKVYKEHPSELARMVVAVARQFGFLHSAQKFEALHVLSMILSSKYSLYVDEALKSREDSEWATNIRSGVVAILHNRVVPAEKLLALMLAERVMSIVGEEWLLGTVTIPDVQDPIPPDRCIMLVLETLKVEIAVLLNDLAYLRYEASKSPLPNVEVVSEKQRNLGIAFSLIEKIIKLVSESSEDEGNPNAVVDEKTVKKIISGLNEAIAEVLRYLEDGKEHGQNKGDDFLACVRVIGSYLAEAPDAGGEKVKGLLQYMLSVQGEDEIAPLSSICFLLPMLCQITMRTDGCELFASAGAYKAVIEYLMNLIGSRSGNAGDHSSISLACDTILNFLLKMEEIKFGLKDSSFVKLLAALSNWALDINESGIFMMASSICALILDLTSEEALLRQPEFSKHDLVKLSHVIKKSLGTGVEEMMSDNAEEETDLHDIVESSYSRWADRYPSIKYSIER